MFGERAASSTPDVQCPEGALDRVEPGREEQHIELVLGAVGEPHTRGCDLGDGVCLDLHEFHFAAVGGEVVIPTDDESFARFDGEFLAFEAGDIDLITRIGWSVTAMGHATYVAFADSVARFHDRNAVPWSIRPGDRHLIIEMEYVSGRRVTLIRREGDNR
ncbi:hypothetical protein [Rhodococcus opacus]|uniref:hypothetical protein n=1 Tax=Rhodococcus opacus TaxID=37919 RepID=UPI0024BA4AF5|nr:hypothetical protein [Rhodococcus opacus]MDJ0419820.1 hypothetical protein [Rhodococcus opacus]